MTKMPMHTPNHQTPNGRRQKVRRMAGFAGAVAMTPYLLIKVFWVIGALVGVLPLGPRIDLTGWVVLNTVTVVMAATGIAVTLVLAGVGGRRIPDAVLLILAWIGVGFLVPMLPYLVASTVLGDDSGGEASGDAGVSLSGWEGALFQVSFIGLGVGLAVALLVAVLERWPALLAGRLGDGRAGSAVTDGRRAALGTLAVIGASTVAVVGLYWAVGGTLGLAHQDARTMNWRLLTANGACWALFGAVATWMLSRARPGHLQRWIPMTIAWAASGFLVAWNCWKLPFVIYLAVDGSAAAEPWPEHLGLAAAQFVLGALAGAAMLATLLASRPGHLAKSR